MSCPQLREQVNFGAPSYETDATLFIPTAANWDPTLLRPGILELKFGAGFDLTDAHIDQIAAAPQAFRHGLRALIAGSPDRSDGTRISVTDKAAWTLTPACPNLQHLAFYSAPGLSGNALSSKPNGLIYLSKIRSITLTANMHEPSFFSAMVVLALQQQPCRTLRYLELGDYWVEPETKPHVSLMTRIIPELEVLFGFGGIWELFRGGVLVGRDGVVDAGKRLRNGVWEEQY